MGGSGEGVNPESITLSRLTDLLFVGPLVLSAARVRDARFRGHRGKGSTVDWFHAHSLNSNLRLTPSAGKEIGTSQGILPVVAACLRAAPHIVLSGAFLALRASEFNGWPRRWASGQRRDWDPGRGKSRNADTLTR